MGMLRLVRQTRAFSLLALLVMLGSVPVAVTAVVHDDGDDAICQPQLVLHDHSAHRIGGARTTTVPQPQHCFVCHWLQSLQTVLAHTSQAIPSSDVHHLALSAAPAGDRRAASDLPARAPPRA
jgi:hypothetical protein